jgi:hypothetical protein
LTGVPDEATIDRMLSEQKPTSGVSVARPVLPAWPRIKLTHIFKPKESQEAYNLLKAFNKRD